MSLTDDPELLHDDGTDVSAQAVAHISRLPGGASWDRDRLQEVVGRVVARISETHGTPSVATVVDAVRAARLASPPTAPVTVLADVAVTLAAPPPAVTQPAPAGVDRKVRVTVNPAAKTQSREEGGTSQSAWTV